MPVEKMYGVIIWAGLAETEAVIWCDDHGSLAYYSGLKRNRAVGVRLDVGDLVRFTVTKEGNHRRARNPQVVKKSLYSGIGKRLKEEACRSEDGQLFLGHVVSLNDFKKRGAK